jgi:glycosyltransferase involved in cell wall biosynthesis
MKLSIIIPCYNEFKTIGTVVKRVIDTPVKEKEIIIVDDGSTDGTRELIKTEIEPIVHRVIYHDINMGKGMAIRSAIRHVTGEITIIQDADLETDPKEYPRLVQPIDKGEELVIYGAREWSAAFRLSPVFVLGNMALTFMTNILYDQRLTDMETCYKVFHSKLLKSISLDCKGLILSLKLPPRLPKKG